MKNIFKKDNIRNKQVVVSLFVIGLILMVVGISYAMYTFSGTGTKENVITTGQITVEFAEQNNILIQNRYPETDAVGLANTDEKSQMTFTVSSNIKGTATVNYAVGLTEIEEGATLTEDYIKINLTKNGSAATGFTTTTGNTIGSFRNETFGELLISHVIARGVVSGTQTDTYTLKAWIHEDYNLPTTDTSSGKVHSSTTTSEEFSFKIKVAGTDATTSDEEEPNIPNAPELASNMIPVMYDGENWVKADVTNEDPNYAWYSYDEKKWANAVTVSNYEVSERSATEEAPKAKLLNSSTLTREQLVNLPVGSVIPMERINTMWVWIPRFNATNGILDCSTLINPTAEKYPQCYPLPEEYDSVTDLYEIVELSEEDKTGLNNMCVDYGFGDEESCSTLINTLVEGGTDEEGKDLKWHLMYYYWNYGDITSEITYEIPEAHKNSMINDMCVGKWRETEEDCTRRITDAITNGADEIGYHILGYLYDYGVDTKYYEKTAKKLYGVFDSTKIISEYNGGTQESPGAFNIDFTSVGEKSHDAFTFGEEDLEGFWIGKFETSHNTLSENTTANNLGCTNETCENAKEIEILPNKISLRNNNVSNFFYAGRSIAQNGNLYGLNKNEVDTHMLKNNEWGAVAYLSQSIYGRCTSQEDCKEIGINNNSSYTTGYGAPAGSSAYIDDDEYVAPQAYDTNQGMDASTTGNIYGVYDMSGGAYEYVMGVYTDGSKLWSGNGSSWNSGFNGCLGAGCASEKQDGVSYPNSKYYNTYTNEGTYDNVISNYTNDLQHALTETGVWYGDSAGFVDGDDPWFSRGGSYFDNGDYPGVFAFDYGGGVSYVRDSFRSALVK